MHSGKEVRLGFASLLLGLVCCGCCTLGAHRRHPPQRQAPAPPPRANEPQPAPPLRIPEAPTAPTPPQPPQVPPGDPSAAVPSPPSAGPEPEAAARITVPLPPGEKSTAVPAVPMTPSAPPHAAQPQADPLANLRRLHRLAAEQYTSFDGCTARLQRREQVRGKDMPPELLLCKFRKQPWSVHFKWIGKEGHDREVVYVKGQYDGKMQIRLAAGDVPFMPAGRLWSIAPENPMAQSRSRHPITEAGLGNLVERFGRLLENSERGDPGAGSLVYLGPQPLPESQAPAEGVEQVVPPGIDKDLPEGGRRLWLFSADNHLPVLMRTTDAAGHEVEFYYYDSVQFPVALSDDDFNPDKLWPRR